MNARLPLVLLAVFALAACDGPSEVPQIARPGEGSPSTQPLRGDTIGQPGLSTDDGSQVAVCVLVSPDDPGHEELSHGVELAQSHSAGQLKDGRQIRWFVEETGSTDESAGLALGRCVTAGAAVAVGPSSIGATMALLPIADANEILLFAPRLGPSSAAAVFENVVVVGASQNTLGAIAAADVIAAAGSLSAGIVHEGGMGGEAAASSFSAGLLAGGGTLVGTREVTGDAVAWKAAAAELASAGAKVLLMTATDRVAVEVAATLGTPPMDKVSVWFLDAGSHPDVAAAAPEAARSRLHGIHHPDWAGQFGDDYPARYEKPPGLCAAYGYSATMAAVHALNVGVSLDAEALMAALVASSEVPTAFGPSEVREEAGRTFLVASAPIAGSLTPAAQAP